MTWNDDYPINDTLANTLHTVIQNTKGLLSDRMKCTNADAWNEHKLCVADEDGLHESSRVGFVKVHTSWVNFEVFTPRVPGSLHFVDSGDSYEGIYTITEEGTIQIAHAIAHNQLSNLDSNTAHSIYCLLTGDTVGADITIASLATLIIGNIDTNNDDPLNPTHLALNFLDAHGVDCLELRHFANDFIKLSDITVLETYIEETTISTDDAGIYSFPMFRDDTDASGHLRLFYTTFHGWQFTAQGMYASRI